MSFCLNCTCGELILDKKHVLPYEYYNDAIILMKYKYFFVLDYIENYHICN